MLHLDACSGVFEVAFDVGFVVFFSVCLVGVLIFCGWVGLSSVFCAVDVFSGFLSG